MSRDAFWILICMIVGCAGFVVGHIHSAASNHVGPWASDDELRAQRRMLNGGWR